jgi:RNA polymerase sigma-70 factor (ECF subfamily)
VKATPETLSFAMARHHQGDGRGAKAGPHLAPASFAQIYEEYADFVWRNARRLGVPAASAEDVLQEVFIVVQRRRADYDGRAPMRSWIFGILMHVTRRHRRTFQRKQAPCLSLDYDLAREPAADAPGSSPYEQAERSERVRLLETLLDQLDEDKRTLLVLSELEEWTLREIAEFHGSNTNTVHSRLRAAKRAFADLHRRWLADRGEVL